jgi:hypothetical protein
VPTADAPAITDNADRAGDVLAHWKGEIHYLPQITRGGDFAKLNGIPGSVDKFHAAASVISYEEGRFSVRLYAPLPGQEGYIDTFVPQLGEQADRPPAKPFEGTVVLGPPSSAQATNAAKLVYLGGELTLTKSYLTWVNAETQYQETVTLVMKVGADLRDLKSARYSWTRQPLKAGKKAGAPETLSNISMFDVVESQASFIDPVHLTGKVEGSSESCTVDYYGGRGGIRVWKQGSSFVDLALSPWNKLRPPFQRLPTDVRIVEVGKHGTYQNSPQPAKTTNGYSSFSVDHGTVKIDFQVDNLGKDGEFTSVAQSAHATLTGVAEDFTSVTEAKFSKESNVAKGAFTCVGLKSTPY